MFDDPVQINLYVPDVPAAVSFYQRVFGFTFKGYWNPTTRSVTPEWTATEPPAYAEVKAGPTTIGLLPGGPPAPRAVTFAVRVASAAEQAKHIREAGGSAADPALQSWGPRMFEAKDHLGYIWNFIERTAGK